MNILLALDSIKDFENSIEIGNYFKEELESENVNNEVAILPFLDGGMGTVEIMKEVIGGDFSYVNVHNPLSEAVTSRYIIKENLCVMEMAQACGLRLLYKDKLDVMESSSIGLGEMIVDGLNNGCEKFFIGIGDTATNDMGMGMLYALGVRFFDKNLNSLNPVAKNMIKVDSIDMSGLDRRIMDVDLEIATSQPLTLFQRNSFLEKRPIRKGASPDEILDKDFENYFYPEDAVTFLEWADKAEGYLPDDMIEVNIEKIDENLLKFNLLKNPIKNKIKNAGIIILLDFSIVFAPFKQVKSVTKIIIKW